jgi:hypothetical protein
MTKSLSHSSIMKVLDWAYEKTLDGVSGLDTVDEMADKFMMQAGTLHEKANSLIRWQNAKAGTSGFITGLGGLITLPVAIPANLASVLFIQIRMIAAIARMGGYDLRDDKVKTLVYVCLAGNFAKDIIQETGIMIGTKLTARVIESVSERSLLAINQRVGFRLLTKYGEKGAINIGKVVPLIGGVIGGTVDLVATNCIGNTARKIFIGS